MSRIGKTEGKIIPSAGQTQELQPNPAWQPGQARDSPSLGFALSLHSYLAAEVRDGVMRGPAAGPGVTGHR